MFLSLYFFFGVAQLTAYRVLMLWVYDRTESLLVATLMHGSLIASTVVLVPTVAAFLTWFILVTIALWAVVAIVLAASGWRLARTVPPESRSLRRGPMWHTSRDSLGSAGFPALIAEVSPVRQCALLEPPNPR